jgi:hypothetical protein
LNNGRYHAIIKKTHFELSIYVRGSIVFAFVSFLSLALLALQTISKRTLGSFVAYSEVARNAYYLVFLAGLVKCLLVLSSTGKSFRLFVPKSIVIRSQSESSNSPTVLLLSILQSGPAFHLLVSRIAGMPRE